MKYSTNVLNLLTTLKYKGIGKAWIVKNLKGNESIETIVNLLKNDIKEKDDVSVENFKNRSKEVKTQIEKLGHSIDGVVALGDINFPKHRGDVKNGERPIVLFYKGNLSLLNENNKNVAVIGLLTPDDKIELIEKKVVSELVAHNVTIVSGLALGCDSIAHREALACDGRTIAILPSTLDAILPTSNESLASEIIEHNGLLITEYYEDIKSKRELSSRYQERDRLQALFSDAIVLSASYSKKDVGKDSGSRLAMGYALNYSIPRAVIYDEFSNKNDKFNLNRELIEDDEKIIIINQNNLIESIKRIVSIEKKSKKVLQIDLFDLANKKDYISQSEPINRHFVTCSVFNWLPIFTRKESMDILLQSLKYLQAEKKLKLYAYVILENHIQIIAQSNDIVKSVEDFQAFTESELLKLLEKENAQILLKQIKSYEENRKYQLWKENIRPKLLKTDEMMINQIEDIHNNPVKRGYVDEPTDWRYSSARNYRGDSGLIYIERFCV